MGKENSNPAELNRREAIGVMALASTLPSSRAWSTTSGEGKSAAIVCFIRYQIDPFQRDSFKRYAENWGRIIPRCGGNLIGYFLPYEGTNDVAWGLIAFESLAHYERYKARLHSDAEARENFLMAESKRLILVCRVETRLDACSHPPAQLRRMRLLADPRKSSS